MGDVFVVEEYHQSVIDSALFIKSQTGVEISATFNNIYVRSDQKNLDTFIKNFKPLYHAGVRSATIPHTQWLLTGKIQSEFPELLIKNTILRDTYKANQVYSEAKAGFHYINLDRDLMRDRDELEKIIRVKKLFPDLKISLLANEGCAGNCPIMTEHYQYNCTRTMHDPQYFNSSIARISCQKWDVDDSAIMLKTANLPPWRSDWVELLELGIDTFKLHGRESINRLFESMSIIEKFVKGHEILFPNFNEYISDNNLEERPINAWRSIIKNCKFDCWDCNFCDKVYASKGGTTSDPLVNAVSDAIAYHDNQEYTPVMIPGLTSTRVQSLLTSLANLSTRYLEIGSFLGATATAVLRSNSIKSAYFVDQWIENIQPADHKILLPKNSKDSFIENIRAVKNGRELSVFDSDLFNVDVTEIRNIDLFFYDGPHEQQTTESAILYYKECISDTAILVFDDANWQGVVDGARSGIIKSNFDILYEKILLNEQEDPNQWWNGVYIVVVKRHKYNVHDT